MNSIGRVSDSPKAFSNAAENLGIRRQRNEAQRQNQASLRVELMADRRLYAILAGNLPTTLTGGSKKETKPRRNKQNGLWKMTPLGNPQKTWIPTAVWTSLLAFPHFRTRPGDGTLINNRVGQNCSIRVGQFYVVKTNITIHLNFGFGLVSLTRTKTSVFFLA